MSWMDMQEKSRCCAGMRNKGRKTDERNKKEKTLDERKEKAGKRAEKKKVNAEQNNR